MRKAISIFLATVLLGLSLLTGVQAKEPDDAFDLNSIDYVGKTKSYLGILSGDTSGNGSIGQEDAVLAVKTSVGLEQPEGRSYKAGDVDGSNHLTSRDALLILQKTAGKIDKFPIDSMDQDPPERSGFEVSTEGLTPNTLYYIPLDSLKKSTVGVLPHDATRMIISMQGLLNRQMDQTRIGLVVQDSNLETWEPYIREHSEVLKDMQDVKVLSVVSFMKTFKAQLIECGMVLWDPDVPATSNVAATICGLDGYIPVKYDERKASLMNQLLDMGVPVKMSLVGKFSTSGLIDGTAMLSSGSSKNDAYLWALEKYGARCCNDLLMFMPDGASATYGNEIYETSKMSSGLDWNRIMNHDYGIYNKTFFFDLSPIDSEAPCDDPDQIVGTDVNTMREILLARYVRAGGKFGEVVGFPPWWFKYSTYDNRGSIIPTTVEATFTYIIGQYNVYMDADGHTANCSLYTQFPLQESYHSIANTKPVTETYDKNTVYLYMYTGDYDSSGWLLDNLYRAYNDPVRGTIPITWSFNPGLCRRVPMVLDYIYANQTENDYFNAADNGIGYVRPQCLFQSQSERWLPDAGKEWTRINSELFEMFDLDSCGFIIGQLSDEVCAMYNEFAPVGSNTNDSHYATPQGFEGTPYVKIKNGIGDPPTTDAQMQQTVSEMFNFVTGLESYHAAGFRTIKYTASEIKAVQDAFLAYAAEKDPGTTYKFVDYKTYFAMLSEALDERHALG